MRRRSSLRKERDVWLRKFKFPREWAYRYEDKLIRSGFLMDWNELNRAVELHNNRDIHLGLFSQPQLVDDIYDTVLIDLDAHNGEFEKVYEVARKTIDRIEEFGLGWRFYFTGRGFNIYVDFEPVKILNYKWVASSLVKEIMGKKFAYVDVVALVDRKRVPKIVGTLNSKADRYVIGIHPSLELDKIFEFSEVNVSFPQKLRYEELDVEVYNRRYEKYLEKVKKEEEELKAKFPTLYFKTEGDYPECIKLLLNKLRTTGMLSHEEKFHLRTFLLRLMPCEDVYRLFEKHLKKFNPDRVLYQLNYAVEQGYRPYSCSKAKDLGLCPITDGRCIFKEVSRGSLHRIMPPLDKNNKCKEDGVI